jgi:hypothetical protein
MYTVTNELAMSCDTGVLGPALLIAGENGDAYDDLLARIRAAVAPADMLEEIWVRDVADLAWEVTRLRRIKANLMRACAHEGLTTALRSLEVRNYSFIASRWLAGDTAAAQTVDAALAAAGLTIDSVTALTVSERIDELERIEKMTTAAEERRDGMLRELEGRRAKLATSLKHALNEAHTLATAPPAAA